MISAICVAVVVLGSVALYFHSPEGALIDFYVAITGVFVGARLAWELQARSELERERRRRVQAGNLLLLSLIRTFESIVSFKKQSVDPERNEPASFITMLPSISDEIDVPEVNYSEIEFLLANLDTARVVHKLSMFETRCKSLVNMISLRSRVHLQQAQPALAANGIFQGKATIDVVKRTLGPQITATLETLTMEIIQFTDELEKESEEVITCVRESLITTEPKSKFIAYQRLESDEKIAAAQRSL